MNSYNRNKRRRYFDNEETPQTPSEVLEKETPKEEETIKEDVVLEEPVAELSAPEIYAKNEDFSVPDPVEEVLEQAISKVREYPTMLETPKTLERNQRRVKARSLRIRKEPSRVASIIGLLKQDEIILVDGFYKDDTWCKLVDEEGNTKGYVMKDFVTPYA